MTQRTPLDPRSHDHLSPYREFTREAWAALREQAIQPLSADEVARLRSLNDRLSLDEVEAIYLPLSRLLSLHVESTQALFAATQRLTRAPDAVTTPHAPG